MKSIDEFLATSCQLARRSDVADPLFVIVWKTTGGDPCRTGCAYFNRGQCDAFRELFPDAAAARDTMRKQDDREQKKQGRQQGTTGYAKQTKKPFRW